MTASLSPSQRAALHLALAGGFGPGAFVKLRDRAPTPLTMLSLASSEVRGLLSKGQYEAWEKAHLAFHGGQDAALHGCVQLLSKGARLLVRGEPGYPARLAELDDASVVLFQSPSPVTEALEQPCVAIVGSREASAYGLHTARLLGRMLGRAGITVVSGCARGIDWAAHEGALDVGGRTVGVLGTVLGEPGDSQTLRARMVERGGTLTEMMPGVPQHAGSFPQRNRLISGLSQVVVVVEGLEGSGTLHTAEAARKQGRTILAVPGPMFEPRSHTPHQLIRSGHARLLMEPDDVLRALNLATQNAGQGSAGWMDAAGLTGEKREDAAPPMAEMEPHLKPIYGVLSKRPTVVDDVALAAGVPAVVASRGLLELELGGWARREAGGAYLKA